MGLRARGLIVLAILDLTIFAAHRAYFPTDGGVDWYFTFSPAVEGWLRGDPVPIYGFANAPWMLWLLLPFYMLGTSAKAGLALFTMAGLVGGWRLFSGSTNPIARTLSLAICLLNMHVLDLIFRAQIDAFVIVSVMCVFAGMRRKNPYWIGVGWVLAGTRPTSIYLILLYSAWFCWRERLLLRALVIPALVFIASLIVFDPGWMERWLVNGRTTPGPWFVTLWRVAEYWQISPLYPTLLAAAALGATVYSLWRYKVDLRTQFALLVAASLLTTPYALSYHYVTMLVVCVPILLAWHRWLVLPILVLTFTPLLRIPLGLDVSWLDIMLPLVLWLMLLVRITAQVPVNHQDAAAQRLPAG